MRSLLGVAADIFATAVALASVFFMALVFYSEAFLHHGITFIEPDVPLATFEFCVTVFGFIAVAVLWWLRLKADAPKAEAPHQPGCEAPNHDWCDCSEC
jgi:hypothetical protein